MQRLSPIELELLLSLADKPRVIGHDIHHQQFNYLSERGYIKRVPVDLLTVEYTITRLGKAAIAGIGSATSEVRR
jgi:hypothetical protein